MCASPCGAGAAGGPASRTAAAGATGARRRLRRGGGREAVPVELEGQPGRFDWRGRSRAGAGTAAIIASLAKVPLFRRLGIN